jgi:beta-glucosidase
VELSETGDIPVEMISVKKCERSGFGLRFAENGNYKMELTIRTNVQSELAQLPMTILKDELLLTTVSLTGADKEWRIIEIPFGEVKEKEARVAFFFRYGGMELKRCRMVKG